MTRRGVVEPCLIPECPNNAQPGKALCFAHEKRKVRGQDLFRPLREQGLSPLELLQRAAVEFSEADTASDVNFRRRLDNLKYAALAWVTRARGHQKLKRPVSCEVCGGPHYARGLCKAHYQQRLRLTDAQWGEVLSKKPSANLRSLEDDGEASNG